jgi:hypothetical protein
MKSYAMSLTLRLKLTYPIVSRKHKALRREYLLSKVDIPICGFTHAALIGVIYSADITV